jgi:hypothetical protein
VDGDCLIVIEVKAVEDRLYLDSGRLVSSTQDTLGKAAQQCDALWGRYLDGREPVFPSGLNTCIPVIVTWRPFFWANDRFYREAVFAPKISHESLLQTCQTINIRDFEDLVATVLNSRRELGELLSIKGIHRGNTWEGDHFERRFRHPGCNRPFRCDTRATHRGTPILIEKQKGVLKMEIFEDLIPNQKTGPAKTGQFPRRCVVEN